MSNANSEGALRLWNVELSRALSQTSFDFELTKQSYTTYDTGQD